LSGAETTSIRRECIGNCAWRQYNSEKKYLEIITGL